MSQHSVNWILMGFLLELRRDKAAFIPSTEEDRKLSEIYLDCHHLTYLYKQVCLLLGNWE